MIKYFYFIFLKSLNYKIFPPFNLLNEKYIFYFMRIKNLNIFLQIKTKSNKSIKFRLIKQNQLYKQSNKFYQQKLINKSVNFSQILYKKTLFICFYYIFFQVYFVYYFTQAQTYLHSPLITTFYIPRFQTMSNRPNFKLSNRLKQQSIKQMNESKQMDTIQRQLQLNQRYLNSEFYQNNQHKLDQQEGQSQSTTKRTLPLDTQYRGFKQKYSTSKHSQPRYKLLEYHSGGGFNSTQPTSPYNKFSTQSNFKDERRSQQIQNQLKKKLFFDDEGLNSPQFNKNQLQLNDFSYTFKKKIDSYPRQFGPSIETQRKSSSKKLAFQSVEFRDKDTYSSNWKLKSKENDFSSINTGNQKQKYSTYQKGQSQNSSAVDQKLFSQIKQRLRFQSIPVQEQQNSIIKQINRQIMKDRIQQQRQNLDFKASRNNQRDLIKRKIIECKSDLKRFYQQDSNNVQYQYHKAKFMDNFLGTNIIQRDLR